MTGEQFSAFLANQGWSDADALRFLGLGSHNTLTRYRTAGPPRLVELACYTLAGPGAFTGPPPFEFILEDHDFRFPLRGPDGVRFEGCRKCGCSRDLIEREKLQCLVPDVLFRRAPKPIGRTLA